MQARTRVFLSSISVGFVASLVAAGLIMAGCSSISQITSTITSSPTVSVPVSITDAPGDQVLAASLTLNSIVLTDSSGKTASILPSPLTFEAAHLDAVQEPLFTPAVPEDTYTSAQLTYSNAQVAYIDPTAKQVVIATATLANTSQTLTFSSPVTVSNGSTSLLIDFLVAQSVSISGSTVTVTPAFHISAVPIPQQPTNGTNGLQCGVKGRVSALGTNSFTLTSPQGSSLVINVNANTQYQGLPGFNALAVNMVVEVDLQTQRDGSLLALRIEEEVPPNATAQMLVGPVTGVSGTPATSFTMLVRQKVGPVPAATPIEKDTITINGSTNFMMPGRFNALAFAGLPFTPTFSASTLFAGQAVAVATNGVTNNSATAIAVAMAPQTVSGTITSLATPICLGCPNQYLLTLPSGSWLATVTGQTTVTVYTNGAIQAINSTAAAVNSSVRFNGFLFQVNGKLVMLAAIEADGAGNAIGPHP